MVKKRVKRNQGKHVLKQPAKWHPVPLKGSFMVLAIIGFFVSYYLVLPLSTSFGVAFMLVFVAMFIASLISMTKAPA